MAKTKKALGVVANLRKKAQGMFTKKQLFVLAGAFGVLAFLIGATILSAKPKQQTIASKTGGNAPTEQVQTPQQPAPAEEAKPDEKKTEAEPAGQKQEQKPAAAPAQQNQVSPTRNQLKVETKFAVKGVQFAYGSVSCYMRMQPQFTHINYAAGASMHLPSSGGTVEYRWEIDGGMGYMEGQFPDFGVTKSVHTSEGWVNLGTFNVHGHVATPFSFRVHVLSPRDVATNWIHVPVSTETCR